MMVIWEMRGEDEGPIFQYFATKKEATIYARLHELSGVEDVTIKKIVVNNRRELALKLNYLAALHNV